MNDESRPALVPARIDTRSVALEKMSGGFDPDFWHVIDREDDALVADEVLNGARSGAFVYDFEIAGTKVQGISIVGAAYLARKYGGLKHRLVSSVEKRGGLFKFTSYPAEGVPMQVTASYVPEFAEDPDYYTVLCEVHDIKTGNAVQTERTELRFERRRDGTPYERPNFATIAQSKAYRNAVLRIVAPDVQQQFKVECVKLGKSKDVTRSVIDEARGNIIAFAARHGIPLVRDQVFAMGMAEIDGLRAAVKEGAPAFVRAIASLGLARHDEHHEQQQHERPGNPALASPSQETLGPGDGAAAVPPAGPVADQSPPLSAKKPLFGDEG